MQDFNYNSSDPILSGIAHTENALHRLDAFMEGKGFILKYDHQFNTDLTNIEAKDRYKVYKHPDSWAGFSQEQIDNELMLTRLALRRDGEIHNSDLTMFSFWPNVVMIKEVGWPLEVGDALGLHDDRIMARVVMAQARQNTNWGINLYACHPFFI
ncbi:MAG: hypothetical protein ACUVQ6_03030 [Dissulfurimicrobium sp.]